jgi:hypothetical protein
MKLTHSIRRVTVALLLLVAFLIQGTWALAGTTGSINGTVVDDTGAPISGATIAAVSPSQAASTTTDSKGNFLFLSLAPDSYTVSVTKDGYQPVSTPGVTVFADQTQTLALTSAKSLETIAKVRTSLAGSLVKAGTTSDIYSVNAATQKTLAGIGGGYNLNSAYSAIYSQPGVSSYIGNYGQGQVFYIRGASYGETGYEFDGVPVNRAFDNYGGSSLSNLGQQELQVYTGGSPSSSTSATLGGYINQVIKTGTYPGFGNTVLGIGGPAFYHNLQFEVGGASPNRLFSYYVGFGGYNQTYHNCNNQNCGNISSDGLNSYGLTGTEGVAYYAFQTGHYGNGPYGACPNQDGDLVSSTAFTMSPGAAGYEGENQFPTCIAFGAQSAGYQVTTSDREVVANFHFGIPHKNDGGKDDVQLLYDGSSVDSGFANSINDLGGLAAFQRNFAFLGNPNYGYAANQTLAATACAANTYLGGFPCASGGPSPFAWADGVIFAPGTQFGQSASSAVTNTYYFPNSPTNRPKNYGLPLAQESNVFNDAGIVKLQYQKNIGSNAYARIYGYSFYSDWLQNDPGEASLYYGLGGYGYYGAAAYPSPDYELETHTRGVSFEYANQINTQNLLRFTANYVTASLNRFNNTTWDGIQSGSSATNAVNSTGQCVAYTAPYAITSCTSSASYGTYGNPTRGGAVLPAGDSFIVTRPSGTGTTNNIIPKFTTLALEDEFRPNDKLDLTLGVRSERYEYDLPNTNTPAYALYFNNADHIYCYNTTTLQPEFNPTSFSAPPPATLKVTSYNGSCGAGFAHPDGVGSDLLYSYISPASLAHTEISPRLGGTYTLSSDTVIRFTAGKYTQPTPAAFEQYTNQYAGSAASSDFQHFFGFGFLNPSHDNPVQSSNNFDVSIEHRLKGSDMTFKLSPFYRDTSHQSVTVPLGPNFVSAVNLGHQISKGVEFQIQKGDPSRDGWSGAISYTYTDAKIQFENAPNGTNAVDTLNTYVKAFNCLTQSGSTGSAAAANGCAAAASPCYDPTTPTAAGNAGDTCALVTDIKNPYYAMSNQALLARNGYYPTYPNSPPGDAPDSAGSTAISPSLFTGWIQFKKDRWAIAPNFVLAQGTAYGGPTDGIGVDPRTCGLNEGQSGAVAGSSAYAQAADFFTCGATLTTASGNLAIPDSYNGNNFETLGQYRNPWDFNVGAQVQYDVSAKVNATLTLANIFNRCFGGSKTAWSTAYPPGSYTCGYYNNSGGTGTIPGAGFFYGASPTDPANGTAPVPKFQLLPYGPFAGAIPFDAYLQFNIKL